jgi:hypothetical protein
MWHSQFYTDNIQFGNIGYNFFDPTTFGMDVYEDPCTKINSNSEFRTNINNKIVCVGQWCSNDSMFKCEKKNTNNCYHVEHIIDTNGGEFKNAECKQIVGNLVMSYGMWNVQLGSQASKNYTNNINEKIEIYGSNKINKVRNIIIQCNPKCFKTMDLDNQFNTDMININILLICIITIFVFLIIYLIVTACTKLYKKICGQNQYEINVI